MPSDSLRKYAYATLVTRASYLAGVIILADTLRRQGSRYPLVVLYTDQLSTDAVRALELEAPRQNLVLRRCEALLPPPPPGGPGVKAAAAATTLIAERFEDTWTKLRVFEVLAEDDYAAVCYLDADMAVRGDADALLTRWAARLPPDHLAASHACVCNRDGDPWAPADWTPAHCAHATARPGEPTQPTAGGPATHHLLNGGLFVFRPSRALWRRMLAFFRTSSSLLATFKFPDQDFLAHFFRGRWHAVGWQYNALKTMRYWHPNLWRDDADVVCLHYIVDKPWTKRIGDDGVAGYRGRDGVTHRWWWDAYDRWESERLGKGENETVVLVRKGVAAPGVAVGWLDTNNPDMKAIGVAVQAYANNQVPLVGQTTKA